jgi:DNA modification methylase
VILNADARAIPLADESVQCVVTSPPYWGLRDYGNATWEGGDPDCDHAYGRFARGGLTGKQASNAGSNGDEASNACRCGATRQDRGIGLEDSPTAWVEQMVAVFREVRRVLRNDGTVWLNVGDAYNNRRVSRPSSHQGGLGFSNESIERPWAEATKLGLTRLSITSDGLKEKDLIGLPWRLAFALQDAGWYLRSDIIWSKPNPMPESVRDRPTKAHEYVFLLTKSPRYYFDADAVRRPAAEASLNRWAQDIMNQNGSARANGGAKTNGPMLAVGGPKKDKQRGHSRRHNGFNDRWDAMPKAEQQAFGANVRTVWEIATMPFSEAHFATFPPKLVEPCIKAGSREGDLVLDPFLGSGTTGIVARKLARRVVGLELNPDYCRMARRRIDRETPANLFDAPADSTSHGQKEE